MTDVCVVETTADCVSLLSTWGQGLSNILSMLNNSVLTSSEIIGATGVLPCEVQCACEWPLKMSLRGQ